METLVKKNQELEILVTDMAADGLGIGKYNGFTIFVEGAISGDKIKCVAREVKKSYAKANLIEILENSKDRVKPVCEHFQECGGCQLQSMKYETQIKVKESIVENALKRIGGMLDVKVNPTIGMNESFRYRNKGTYIVKSLEASTNIGFYKKKTHELVDIEDCKIQDEKIGLIINTFKKYMKDFDVKAYNKKANSGIIKKLMIRKSDSTNEMMVVVVTKGRKLAMTKILASKLVEVDSRIVSIIQNINNSSNTNGFGEENKLLYGKNTINDIIDGIEFEISAESFYQVNSEQTKNLYKKVIEYANVSESETVLDLYCGIGTISLLLAKKAKKVYGIENVESAINNAKTNSEKNNINNVEFILGDAEKSTEKFCDDKFGIDVVVLDPPRAGCAESVISMILRIQPNRIVYVSCNPATLSRDIKDLVASGKYELTEVQPLDMFPYTGHVETVVSLYRKQ